MYPANLPKSTAGLWAGLERYLDVESIFENPTGNYGLEPGEP
jgi:hypothetical protein